MSLGNREDRKCDEAEPGELPVLYCLPTSDGKGDQNPFSLLCKEFFIYLYNCIEEQVPVRA